ncbi:MAG TPA: response regulator transcription factor [Roseiflexaceae bacterium]|nr:response regulator transcription factor [Roseiflexaceae bacterium]
MSILVVEDDEFIRLMLAEALTDEGYSVLAAENGRMALDLLHACARLPALILLDLMMPVMSGWEFCAELDRDPALAGIPVVVLSAMPQPAAQASGLRVEAVVAKPVDLDELLALAARFDHLPTGEA